MRLRFAISVLAVALLAAGCFSAGSSFTQAPPTLFSSSQLDIDGPDLQYVTVEARTRDGRPASFDGLQVSGRTAEGGLVEVDWSVPALAGDGDASALEAGTSPNAFTFAVDVARLREQDVVALEVALGGSVLQVPLQAAGAGSQDAGDEAEAAEVDAGEYFEVPDDGRDTDPEALWQGEAWEGGTEVGAQAVPRNTRQVRTLRAGTSQATQVYIIRSSVPGPTVMVVGGVHGSETAGWRAAGEIKDWQIDRGTLVVLPQANRPAVQRNRRTGPDGIDLNRQFPVGATPRTALAREIWNLVREFRPVALMDLHEGWGLRRLGHRFPGGTLSVGQTLITYPARDARSFASYVTRYVDTYYVAGGRTYSFMIIGPPTAGSLARKAGAELGIPAFIVEPTQHQTTVATRTLWHKAFVQELLKWYGLVNKSRTLVPRRRAAVELFDTGTFGQVAQVDVDYGELVA